MPNCKQCQSPFKIQNDDRQLFEQLKIPEPTLCPKCRNIRRMTWRNDRTFYHDKSALSGKPMISMYPPGTPYTVYLQDEWYGDKWDAMNYAREFDFSRPFFEQFAELQLAVPRMNLDIVNCENSEYCNYCGDEKNCYLDIAGEANEDCYFNLFVKYSKDVMDCTFVYKSNHCYESINCHECYNLYYGEYCNNTSDSMFAYDMIGCKNCLFSYNLRNKEYYIFNEKHTKEEYEKKRDEIFNGSYKILQGALKIWREHLKKNAIFRDTYQANCEKCIGNNLKNCKNVQFGFNVTNAEDSKYLYDVLDAKNCSDLNYSLYKPELSYELISTLSMTHSAFNMASHFCHDVFYCDQCNHSKHLFGCNALTHKEYCIFNKQYSKDEYYELKDKIIEHMKSGGEWGQFFSSKFSPFGYNETVAQEYYPIDKKEAQKHGLKWADEVKTKNHKASAYQLPDSIKDVKEDIINQVLTCEESGKPYKIIEQELRYYKNHNLPISRRSPHQRHLDRMSIRAPRRLWERECDKCKKSIGTTFAPDMEEKVLCEGCYLKEVY